MAMPVVITRDEFSAEELRAKARRERDGRIRVRMLMIAHMLDGVDREAAARMVGLARQASYDWPKRYNAEGIAGLGDRRRPGRPPKLDAEQVQQFKQRIGAGADIDRDGVTALRGVDVRDILQAEFGVSYSLSGTFNLLHRLRLSWLCPRPSHPQSDAEEAAVFRKRLMHN
jgi:transposase